MSNQRQTRWDKQAWECDPRKRQHSRTPEAPKRRQNVPDDMPFASLSTHIIKPPILCVDTPKLAFGSDAVPTTSQFSPNADIINNLVSSFSNKQQEAKTESAVINGLTFLDNFQPVGEKKCKQDIPTTYAAAQNVEELQKRINELEKKNEKLESDLNCAANAARISEETAENYREDVKRLRKQNEELAKERESLKNEKDSTVQTYTARIEKLEKQKEEITKQYDNLNETHHKLLAKQKRNRPGDDPSEIPGSSPSQKEAPNPEREDFLKKELQVRIDELEKENTNLKKENSSLKAQQSVPTPTVDVTEFKQLKSEVKKHQEALERKNSIIRGRDDELKTVKNVRLKLEKALSTQQAEHKKELDLKADEYNNLVDEYNKLSKEFTDLKKRAKTVESLRSAMEEVKLELSEIRQETDTFNREQEEGTMAGLKILLDKMNKQKDDYTAGLIEIKKVNDELQSMNCELATKLAQLEQEHIDNRAVTKLKDDLTERVQQLVEKESEYKTKIQELEEQLKKNIANSDQLNKLKNLQVLSQNLITVRSEQAETISNLRAKIDQLEKELTAAQDQINELGNQQELDDLRKKISELQKSVQQKDQEQQTLNVLLRDARNDGDLWRQRYFKQQ